MCTQLLFKDNSIFFSYALLLACNVVDEGFVLFRLSKILEMDLGPLLIAEVLFSNVGGTATGNV